MPEWWYPVTFSTGLLLAFPAAYVLVVLSYRYVRTPVLFYSIVLGGCLLYGLLVAAVVSLPIMLTEGN